QGLGWYCRMQADLDVLDTGLQRHAGDPGQQDLAGAVDLAVVNADLPASFAIAVADHQRHRQIRQAWQWQPGGDVEFRYPAFEGSQLLAGTFDDRWWDVTDQRVMGIRHGDCSRRLDEIDVRPIIGSVRQGKLCAWPPTDVTCLANLLRR